MERFTAACATLTLVVAVLVCGCAGSSDLSFAPTTVEAISPAQMRSLIGGGEPLAILDVRTPAEYAAWSIPGSVNIPLDELRARLGELDRRTPLVCVCTSGNRSAQAAEVLAAAGFTRVMNLEGGIAAWNEYNKG